MSGTADRLTPEELTEFAEAVDDGWDDIDTVVKALRQAAEDAARLDALEKAAEQFICAEVWRDRGIRRSRVAAGPNLRLHGDTMYEALDALRAAQRDGDA
jgi:hypothetical protein